MASITIRDLPDHVIDGLKERARRHGRSLEAEVRALLTRHVLDRRLVMEILELQEDDLARETTADEVDGWLSATRERRA